MKRFGGKNIKSCRRGAYTKAPLINNENRRCSRRRWEISSLALTAQRPVRTSLLRFSNLDGRSVRNNLPFMTSGNNLFESNYHTKEKSAVCLTYFSPGTFAPHAHREYRYANTTRRIRCRRGRRNIRSFPHFYGSQRDFQDETRSRRVRSVREGERERVPARTKGYVCGVENTRGRRCCRHFGAPA